MLLQEAPRRGGISISCLATNVKRGTSIHRDHENAKEGDEDDDDLIIDELLEMSDVIFTKDDSSYFEMKLNDSNSATSSGCELRPQQTKTLERMSTTSTHKLSNTTSSVSSSSAPSSRPLPLQRSESVKISDRDLDKTVMFAAQIANLHPTKEIVVMRQQDIHETQLGSLHVRHVKRFEKKLDPREYPLTRQNPMTLCRYEELSEKVEDEAAVVLGNVTLRSLVNSSSGSQEQQEPLSPSSRDEMKENEQTQTKSKRKSCPLIMQEDTYRIIRVGILAPTEAKKKQTSKSNNSSCVTSNVAGGGGDAYIAGYLLAHLACMGQHDQLQVSKSVELLPLYAMDMELQNLLLTHVNDERIKFYLLLATWVAGAKAEENASGVSNSSGGDSGAGGLSLSLPIGSIDMDEMLGTDIVTVKRRLMELIS